MRLFIALKKNIVSIIFLAIVVGLLIYMTQAKEEFKTYSSVSEAIRLSEPYPKVNDVCTFDSYNAIRDNRTKLITCKPGYKIQGSKCVKSGIFKCPPNTIRYDNKCQKRCPPPYISVNFGRCKNERKDKDVVFVDQVNPVCTA